MSSFGEETNFGFRWKLYCYSSQSHLARENFVCRSPFCLFFFYVFFFWAIETSTSNFQGLTHSKPAKCTNQITISDKHMANELSLLGVRWPGSLQHKSLAGFYFSLHVSCWPKERHACSIDHRQWYLRYDILDVKNLPKISEELTIVTNLATSSAWFERVLSLPCRGIVNPPLRKIVGPLWENSWWLIKSRRKNVDCFRKKLHFACLTGF